MLVEVTKEKVVVTQGGHINEGEMNVNLCSFSLPMCFEELNVTACFNGIPVPVVKNRCTVPALKKGTATLGVYAYKEGESGIELIYSPEPTCFCVHEGSFSEDFEQEIPFEISEYEQYCNMLRDEFEKTEAFFSQAEEKRNKAELLRVDAENVRQALFAENEAERQATFELNEIKRDLFGDVLTIETLVKGGNLFDKSSSEIMTGYYCKPSVLSDDLRSDQYRFITHYIPVTPENKYTTIVDANFFGEAGAAKIPSYNKDKEYIGFFTGTVIDNSNAKECRLTLSVNATEFTPVQNSLFTVDDVSYIRLTYRTDYIETYMVVEGESYPDDYRVYGDTIYNVSIKQEKVPNKLTGKTVVFAGDSICHAHSEIGGGWAKRIGEKNNMVWENKGVNGRTITKGVNETSICETDFGENPDYIILEGGTNDADKFLNSPEKFGSYSPHDYVSDFDEETFCGAVESLFKRVTTDYAGAKIGFIIAQKMGTGAGGKWYNNRRYYFDTIIELCKKWGIPYIDLWNGSYLNPSNPAHYTEGSETNMYTDGQHLTSAGYDYITSMIEAWMLSL